MAGLAMVSVVVAHDGVRLICACWVPHDDDSDVNVVWVRTEQAIQRRSGIDHNWAVSGVPEIVQNVSASASLHRCGQS